MSLHLSSLQDYSQMLSKTLLNVAWKRTQKNEQTSNPWWFVSTIYLPICLLLILISSLKLCYTLCVCLSCFRTTNGSKRRTRRRLRLQVGFARQWTWSRPLLQEWFLYLHENKLPLATVSATFHTLSSDSVGPWRPHPSISLLQFSRLCADYNTWTTISVI